MSSHYWGPQIERPTVFGQMGRPYTSKPPLLIKKGLARAFRRRQKAILLQSSSNLQSSMRQDHKGTQKYCGVISSDQFQRMTWRLQSP